MSASEITCKIEYPIAQDANDEEEVSIMTASGYPTVCFITVTSKGDGCKFTFVEPEVTYIDVDSYY